MSIENALQGEEEMCVKTEWQQYFKAQTQDYFLEILTGNSWFNSLTQEQEISVHCNSFP